MNTDLPIPDRAKSLIELPQSLGDADAGFDSPPESLFATGAAIAAGVATRRGCKALWKNWRGAEPPTNPDMPGVTWADALMWAVAVGAAVGVARVLSRRSTTAAARRLRHRRTGW